MPHLARLLLITAAAGGLAGCLAPQTADPYPAYGNAVNPTPARGYRVECRSAPTPFYFLFNDYKTGCVQVIPPVPNQVLVRARG